MIRRGDWTGTYKGILQGSFFWACTGLLLGCSSAEQKSAHHLADAEHWAAEGKTNEAVLEYRRAIHLNPKDPKAHLALARIFIDRQEYPSAYEQLRAVQKVAPEDHEAKLLSANVMLKTHNFLKAIEQVQPLLKKNPDDSQALLILAQSSYATKDQATAAVCNQPRFAAGPKKQPGVVFKGHFTTV